jgi:hypothetical protein
MGLDMYLEAKKSLYKSWREAGKETEEDKKSENQRNSIYKVFPELESIRHTGNIEYLTITAEAGYWRKANQIHKWFVDNVQDGNDNCGHYDVSRDQLKELKTLCEEVLQRAKVIDGMVEDGYTIEKGGVKKTFTKAGLVITNPEVASELLPTTSGFFFGGTNYDEYYLKDLKNTVEIIDRCLKLPEEWDFRYNSSW